MPPATEQVLQYFSFDHLPASLKTCSAQCAALAHAMVALCPENCEVTMGLRKLLEAKDCFVRSLIAKTPEEVPHGHV